ncbi:MAG: glycerol-3-phosphate dehydrogenase [Sphingopyxis sp.]|nr:glycerol-3-phosphate dehydrogenase [Sphingopyxis sp.]
MNFDLIVIGGGINGAGIARDAAGRGARVALLERGDLAQGTSSASTKLIHGGLRYLEHYEFGLVREALTEREKLWAIAPHIIHPMRFVLPHQKGLRPRWLLRAGLFLYDHIGGRRKLPATRTINLARHVAGRPLKPGFGTAFEYSDGWVDDARLVILNARDAADRGATIFTRCAVRGISRAGGSWHVETVQGTMAARAIVNAAGPSVLDLLDVAGQRAQHGLRLVRGSHIVVPKLFDHSYSYFFQLPDGRIFFAIPYERHYTLIGTTDCDHPDTTTPPRATDEEIAYLCDGANQYFATAITPADVVWTYSGVRPLIDDGSGKPEAATRGYTFETVGGTAPDDPLLLSVFGGKITTYRHLAKDAVELLANHIAMSGAADWTAGAALPGGDFAMDALDDHIAALKRDYPFLAPDDVDRIGRAYGTCAQRWLGDATSLNALGAHFGAGLTSAEVDYLITHEWAETPDDVLWRRTKLGLRMDAAGVEALSAHMSARIANTPHVKVSES